MTEDNGDFESLPPCGDLYVCFGIFHGFIAKRPIPGPSVRRDATARVGHYSTVLYSVSR